jgi:hypothetical protein
LFLADERAQGIHVVLDDGRTYSHKIEVSWGPKGVHIMGSSLYVTDAKNNKLYKLTLDSAYNKISAEVIISSTLSHPRNIYVDADRIAISNPHSNQLSVYRNDGVYGLEWQYDLGGLPRDLARNNCGNYVINDNTNKRIQLVSSEGQFIKNVVDGLEGNPLGLALTSTCSGSTMYVTTTSPNKLFKYVLN